MVVTKYSNVNEVADYHDLAPGQVLYLGMVLQNYDKVEISGFGGQAKFAPMEEEREQLIKSLHPTV